MRQGGECAAAPGSSHQLLCGCRGVPRFPSSCSRIHRRGQRTYTRRESLRTASRVRRRRGFYLPHRDPSCSLLRKVLPRILRARNRAKGRRPRRLAVKARGHSVLFVMMSYSSLIARAIPSRPLLTQSTLKPHFRNSTAMSLAVVSSSSIVSTLEMQLFLSQRNSPVQMSKTPNRPVPSCALNRRRLRSPAQSCLGLGASHVEWHVSFMCA